MPTVIWNCLLQSVAIKSPGLPKVAYWELILESAKRKIGLLTAIFRIARSSVLLEQINQLSVAPLEIPQFQKLS